MSAWWLFLIIPVVFCFGFAACAILTVGAAEDRRMERMRDDVKAD